MPTTKRVSNNAATHKPFRQFQVVQIVNAKYPENEGIYGYVTSDGLVRSEHIDGLVYEIVGFRGDEKIKFVVEPQRLRAAL